MSLQNQAIRHAIASGYHVDEDGSVSGPRGPLKPRLRGRSVLYWHISVKFSGQTRALPVHRLAGYQRFGEAALQPGVHICHGDAGPLDNSIGNLRLGTASENEMDKSRETRVRVAKLAIAKRWERVRAAQLEAAQ